VSADAIRRRPPDAIVATMAKTRELDLSLEKALAGALRATIRDHGPITAEHIGSAVKRIMGQLPNAKASGLARALGLRRWEGTTPEERSAIASDNGRRRWDGVTTRQRKDHAKAVRAGVKGYWDRLSPEERTAEMERRAEVRAANRAAREKDKA
jgi:hypothetical protein